MVSKDKNLNMVGFLEPFYHRQWWVENRELCGNLEEVVTFHQLHQIFKGLIKYILTKRREETISSHLKQLWRKRRDENYLQIFSEQLGKSDRLDRSFASFAKEGLEPAESFKQGLPEKLCFIITAMISDSIDNLYNAVLTIWKWDQWWFIQSLQNAECRKK